jgi:hypothetical protein
MRLHSSEFEQRLRVRVRPAWRAARKRQRLKTPSRSRGLSTEFARFYFLSIAAGRFWDLHNHGWAIGARAALLGLFLTWFAVCFYDAEANWSGPDFAVLYRLPAADDTIFAWGWRRLWRTRWSLLIVIAFSLAVLWLGQTVIVRSDLWKIALVAGLGTAALTVATTVQFPVLRKAKLRIIFLGLAVALIALLPESLPQQLLRDQLIRFGPFLNWLHPGGWIVALWSGWAERPPSATIIFSSFLLAALVGLTRWSRKRLRSTFDSGRHAALPREVLTAEALSEREILDRPETTRERIRENWGSLPETSLKTRPADADPKLHLTPETLTCDALGRWFERRCSERERMLMALLCGENLNFGRKWFAACRAVAVAFLIATVLNVARLPTTAFFVMAMGSIMAFLHVVLNPLGDAARLAATLPISYREIARLEWRLASLRFAIFFAPVLAFSSGFAFFTPLSWSECLALGAKIAVLTALSRPFFTVWRFSTQESDRTTWRRLVLLLALAAFIGAALFGVAAIVFGWTFWPFLILAAASFQAMLAFHRMTWGLKAGFPLGQS